MTVDRKVLAKAVNELNSSGVLEKKINPVQSTEKLVAKFIEVVRAIPDELESKIPDSAIDMYNSLVQQKPAVEEKPEEKEKPKKEKKEMKKVETKKAPAKKTNKVSNASKVDALLIKGGKTYQQIADAVGGKLSSVRNHIQDLRRKGKKINCDDDGKLSMKG